MESVLCSFLVKLGFLSENELLKKREQRGLCCIMCSTSQYEERCSGHLQPFAVMPSCVLQLPERRVQAGGCTSNRVVVFILY